MIRITSYNVCYTKLLRVAGSDSHIPEMVGQAYTEIDASENTVEAVLRAIREGKVAPAGKSTSYNFV